MKKPKKLIRENIPQSIKPEEIERITDLNELNQLYKQKIQEELIEIEQSNFLDKKEFADLLQVVINFAEINGISEEKLMGQKAFKAFEKGEFTNIALNNLNPNNPSNNVYFENTKQILEAKIMSFLIKLRSYQKNEISIEEILNQFIKHFNISTIRKGEINNEDKSKD